MQDIQLKVEMIKKGNVRTYPISINFFFIIQIQFCHHLNEVWMKYLKGLY